MSDMDDHINHMFNRQRFLIGLANRNERIRQVIKPQRKKFIKD